MGRGLKRRGKFVMEPIVSPWFIYLLGLLGPITAVSALLGITSFVILLIFTFFKYIDDVKDEDNFLSKTSKRLFLIIGVICIMFSLFIPNKNTLISMYVAKNITYENIEKITKKGEDIKGMLKKDIMDMIREIKKEEK